jgi:spore coat polysaccharide biosynthesis predicted glycosyltransferase SpsG
VSELAWPGTVTREDSSASASKAIKAMDDGVIESLIVDSYAVPETEVNDAVKSGFTVAFRDGPPYGSESLTVDPNPGAEEAPSVLGGPAYMPLAPAFAARRRDVRMQQAASTGSILIAFGARDSANRTMTALQALMRLPANQNVIVLLPATAPHAADVSALAKDQPWVRYVGGVIDLGSLYSDCKLAIGAPGVSQFERACCGLPTVLVAQNAKQAPLARNWEDCGAAFACEATEATIADAVAAVLRDPDRLRQMSERCLSLVDGNGAARLAAELNDRRRVH